MILALAVGFVYFGFGSSLFLGFVLFFVFFFFSKLCFGLQRRAVVMAGGGDCGVG